MTGCCFGNARCAGPDGRVAQFDPDEHEVFEAAVNAGSFLLSNCHSLHEVLAPDSIRLPDLLQLVRAWRDQKTELKALLRRELESRVSIAEKHWQQADRKISSLELQKLKLREDLLDKSSSARPTRPPAGGKLAPLPVQPLQDIDETLGREKAEVQSAEQDLRQHKIDARAARVSDHLAVLVGLARKILPGFSPERFAKLCAAEEALGIDVLNDCLNDSFRRSRREEGPAGSMAASILQKIEAALEQYQCRDCGTCMLCHASPNRYVSANKLLGFAFRKVDATETWGLKYPVSKSPSSNDWVRLDAVGFGEHWKNGTRKVPVEVCWNWFYRMQNNEVDESFQQGLRFAAQPPLELGSALSAADGFPQRWLLENVNEWNAHNCEPGIRLLCKRCRSLVRAIAQPAQPTVSIERIKPAEQQQAGQTAQVTLRFDGPIFSPRLEHVGIAGGGYPAANVEIVAPEFDVVDADRVLARIDDSSTETGNEAQTASFTITSELACAGMIKLRDPRWCKLGESISLPYRFVDPVQALPIVTFVAKADWNNQGSAIPVYDHDLGEPVSFKICRLGDSGSAINGKLCSDGFPAPIPFVVPSGNGDQTIDVPGPSSAQLKLRAGETESTWSIELQVDEPGSCRLSETVRAMRVFRSPVVLDCGTLEKKVKSEPCNLKLLRVTELHSGEPPDDIHPGSKRKGIFVVRNEAAFEPGELPYHPDRPKEPPLIQVTAGSVEGVSDQLQGHFHQTHLKVEVEGKFCDQHPKLRVIEIGHDRKETSIADSQATTWSGDIFRADQSWDKADSIAEKSIKEFFKYIYRNRQDLDPLLEDLESTVSNLADEASRLAEEKLLEAREAARQAEQAIAQALNEASEAILATARQAAEKAATAAKKAQDAAAKAAVAAAQVAACAADALQAAAAAAANAARQAAEAARHAAAAAKTAAEEAAAAAAEVADEALAAAARAAAAAAQAAAAAADAAEAAAAEAAEAAADFAKAGAQAAAEAARAAAAAAQLAGQAAGEAAQVIVDAGLAAAQTLAEAAEAAIRSATDLAREVAEAAAAVAEKAEALARRIAEDAKAIARGVADEVKLRYRQALEAAKEVARQAKEIADQARRLAEQIAEAAAELAQALADAARKLAQEVASAVGDAAKAAREAAKALAEQMAGLLQQAANLAREAAASAARAAQACADRLVSVAATALSLMANLLKDVPLHAPGLPRGDMPRSPKNMRLKQYRIVAECCGVDCDPDEPETHALAAMIQVFPSDEFVLHFDGPKLTPFEIVKEAQAASSEDETIGFEDVPDPSRTQNLTDTIEDVYLPARTGLAPVSRSRSFQGTNKLERPPPKSEETDSLLKKMYSKAKSLIPNTTGEVVLLHNGVDGALHGQALSVAESMVRVLQSAWAVQDVWNGLQGLVPTVGWGFEVGIAIMEGELDWQWGFKEFDDHRVFYWEEAGTELTVARIYFRLYIGPRLRILFVKFECVLYGLITLDFGYKSSWEVKGPKAGKPTTRISAKSAYPDASKASALVDEVRRKADQAVDAVNVAKDKAKQKLGMAVEVKVEQPDTAGASERGSFEKAGDGSWYQAATRAELGANLVLLHENILHCNAAVKTGYKIRVRRLEDHPGMEAETYFIGLSFVATASCKLFKEKRKIVPILAGDPLGSPRSRMVVPREPGEAWDDLRKRLASVAGERDRREDRLTAALSDWNEIRLEMIANTKGVEVDESELNRQGPAAYWEKLKASFALETEFARRGRLRPKHNVREKLLEHSGKAEEAAAAVVEMIKTLQKLVPELEKQAQALTDAEYELAGRPWAEVKPRQQEMTADIDKLAKQVKANDAKSAAAGLTNSASDLAVWARLRTTTVALPVTDAQLGALLPEEEIESNQPPAGQQQPRLDPGKRNPATLAPLSVDPNKRRAQTGNQAVNRAEAGKKRHGTLPPVEKPKGNG